TAAIAAKPHQGSVINHRTVNLETDEAPVRRLPISPGHATRGSNGMLPESLLAPELDAIIELLDTVDDVLPEKAFEFARAPKSEIIPRLIGLIDRAAANAAAGEIPPTNGHYFALFLLAEFRATEALPAIVRAVSLPDELPSTCSAMPSRSV